MEIPKKVGLRRLLLTDAQKYLLDVQRLGSNAKIDKVEKAIIFLEELTPNFLIRRAKRHGTNIAKSIYWHVTPKRLKVSERSSTGHIHPYLPWFSKGKCEQHLYRMDGVKKVLMSSSGKGHNGKNYTYSWKKAYIQMKENQHKLQQEELQYKLNFQLNKKQLKGGILDEEEIDSIHRRHGVS